MIPFKTTVDSEEMLENVLLSKYTHGMKPGDLLRAVRRDYSISKEFMQMIAHEDFGDGFVKSWVKKIRGRSDLNIAHDGRQKRKAALNGFDSGESPKRKRTMKEHLCFNCMLPGHYKRNCPALNGSDSKNEIRCYGCRLRGHLLKDCPWKHGRKLPDYRICDKWNRGICKLSLKNCMLAHVCNVCKVVSERHRSINCRAHLESDIDPSRLNCEEEMKRKDMEITMGPGTVVKFSSKQLNGHTGVIESFQRGKGLWRVYVDGEVVNFKNEDIKMYVEDDVPESSEDVKDEMVDWSKITLGGLKELLKIKPEDLYNCIVAEARKRECLL